VPLPDIPIQLGIGGPAWNPQNTWTTVSGDDGSFSFSTTLTSVLWRELFIMADDDGVARALYSDYLELLMPVSIEVSMDKVAYQTGEKATGTVEVWPDFDDTSDRWSNDLYPLIQVIGPTGGNEQTFILGYNLYKAHVAGFVTHQDSIDFWWVVPDGTAAGSYRVEVVVTGQGITTAEGQASFSVEEANSVNFYADFSSQAPDYDRFFYPGRVYGRYSDHLYMPIDNADVRIIAVNTNQRTQEVELKTTTDQAGEFNLTLEKLNYLGGSEKIMWELRVYADKEGYRTGEGFRPWVDVVWVDTPIALPRVEIIEADPLTNDLELQAYNGRIDYSQSKPYTIKLLVKYTTYEAGTDLWVNTWGDWALKPDQVVKADNGVVLCSKSSWKQSVSINGVAADPIGYYDAWEFAPNSNFPGKEVWGGARHGTLIPLDQGIGKEMEITISGELFNFQCIGDDPNKDPMSCVMHTPLGQSPILDRRGSGGVYIGMALVSPIEKPLIVEDGPFSCLNLSGCEEIGYLLQKVARAF
jgi:hypothetical protein